MTTWTITLSSQPSSAPRDPQTPKTISLELSTTDPKCYIFLETLDPDLHPPSRPHPFQKGQVTRNTGGEVSRFAKFYGGYWLQGASDGHLHSQPRAWLGLGTIVQVWVWWGGGHHKAILCCKCEFCAIKFTLELHLKKHNLLVQAMLLYNCALCIIK